MIHYVFCNTSAEHVIQSSAAVGAHSNQIGLDLVRKIYHSRLLIDIIANVKRIILQHEVLGETFKPGQGNIVARKVARRIDPDNVQRSLKKIL